MPQAARAALLAMVLLIGQPAAALAHEGEAHLSAPEVLRWWTWDPWVLACLGLSGYLYGRGLRRVWRRAGAGHGVRRWEAAAYAAGLFSIAVALISPLDALSDILFSAHMSQHEVLMLVAAPLVVLVKPVITGLWALPEDMRERALAVARAPRVSRGWRLMTGPFVVLVVHALALWVWHIPALFEAALASEAVHAAQHLIFFVTAALFWWALIHGRYGRVGYGVAVVYVFATALHSSILGALLTMASRLWYPSYEARTGAWSLDPLEDQQLAGLIMWCPRACSSSCSASRSSPRGWARRSEG